MPEIDGGLAEPRDELLKDLEKIFFCGGGFHFEVFPDDHPCARDFVAHVMQVGRFGEFNRFHDALDRDGIQKIRVFENVDKFAIFFFEKNSHEECAGPQAFAEDEAHGEFGDVIGRSMLEGLPPEHDGRDHIVYKRHPNE